MCPQADDPRYHDGLPDGAGHDPRWEVTPQWVHQRRDDGDNLVLIDCRTELEFGLVRIEGSLLWPLADLAGRLDEIESLSDKKLVVYCHHGYRSRQMVSMLRQMGVEDVKSMAGGIDRWSLQIDPSVPRY